jgi:hypothetical protein
MHEIRAKELRCYRRGQKSSSVYDPARERKGTVNTMKNRLASRLALASLLALPASLSTPAAGAGPDEGTASGKLVVGGRTTPLSHVYARVGRDQLDNKKERYLVVLSDVPLPPEEFLEQFPGLKLAAKGKAHVVTVELKPDKSVVSGALLHEAFAATDSFQGSGTNVFGAKTCDGKVVEGTLATEKPGEFEKTKYEYKATFRAPLWRRPAPTATGPAAAQTPQGKAALAFLKAVTSGDKAGTRKALSPDAEAAKALDGPQAANVLKMLGSINPKPAAAKVESVTVLGNGAEVTVSGPKTADDATSHTMILALVGGDWRVAGEMTEPWW